MQVNDAETLRSGDTLTPQLIEANQLIKTPAGQIILANCKGK